MRRSVPIGMAAAMLLAAPAAAHHGPNDCRMAQGTLPQNETVTVTVEGPAWFQRCSGHAVQVHIAGGPELSLRTRPAVEEGTDAVPAPEDRARKPQRPGRRNCTNKRGRQKTGGRCRRAR